MHLPGRWPNLSADRKPDLISQKRFTVIIGTVNETKPVFSPFLSRVIEVQFKMGLYLKNARHRVSFELDFTIIFFWCGRWGNTLLFILLLKSSCY